jgi:hypothetical protein
MSCGAKHPEHPELACVLDTARPHPLHLVTRYADGSAQPMSWANPEYQSPHQRADQSQQAGATIKHHAAAVRQQIAQQQPLGSVRDQRKKTRLGQVASLLVNNVGTWIEGHRLETIEVGGSSGLRRVRELRDEYGWKIVNEPDPDHPGSTDRYMLVELPDEFKDG